MCAAPGQVTCSETPRPTGRSRSGTAEVDSCRRGQQPVRSGKVVIRGPHKPETARSLWTAKPARTLRSNGPKAERSEHSGLRNHSCRVRLDGQGHRTLASPLLRRAIRERRVRSARSAGRAAGAGRRPRAQPEQSRTRRQINRSPVELTLRGGNRPQGLGGTGTRHRKPLPR